MLKVAVVGCGKISDMHVSQILRIKGCEIVGVCDTEPLMARQLYERYPIRNYYSDVELMLSEARPDVVHITTPPDSHCALASMCLERGCHVYVEKPFTVDENEAQYLIQLANKKGLKITVGHDDQFSHAMRRMRKLVHSGYLGGEPTHMESYYGYSFGKSGYSGALLNDKQHWVRGLPGQLLQNIISHGIARIAEFLTTDSPTVIAHGFTSPGLKQHGENEIIDELRVIISEKDRTTAYFTFSSQMRPCLYQFRLYGTQNGLVVDRYQETLITLRGQMFKSYLEQFAPPLIFAKQYVKNFAHSLKLFMARDFHGKSGMKYLIETFYSSITDDAPLPIPYREILLTTRIMDEIFVQLAEQRQQPQERREVSYIS